MSSATESRRRTGGGVQGRWLPGVGAAVGVAAVLARAADGRSFLAPGIEIVLQLPGIAAWFWLCGGLFSTTRAPARTGSRGVESGLAMVVLVGALGLALARQRLDLPVAMLTCFVAAMLVVDVVGGWMARLAGEDAGQESRQNETSKTISTPALLGWLVLMIVGAAVLSVPAATVSAVPDYRHNFWRHVLFCGQTATSAACLVGVSGYDIGEDFSRFGQIVIYLLMQIGALGVAAVGVRIARSLLPRPVTLRGVGATMVTLQIGAACLLMPAWNAADASDLLQRAGWSFFHAAAALYNCGFSLRADGLAAYLTNKPVYILTTALGIVGSIGIPYVMALTGARRGRAAQADAVDNGGIRGLINIEFAAAFWLLLVGAVVLWIGETPGALPEGLRSTRPYDLGPQLPLGELPGRWRAAVFLSAAARSSGFGGVSMAEGALNWVSLGVLCAWMLIGGGACSFAGGLRTTSAVAVYALTFGASGGASGGNPNARAARRGVIQLMACMIGLSAASVGLLALTQQASVWERIVDGWSAANGVGWTSGLAAHLTWPARGSMIAVMLAGRLIPMIGWVGIAARLGESRRNATRAERPKK